MLDAALNQAEESLTDWHIFVLGSETWDAIVAALDAPPRRHARLERLFKEPSVFDPKNKS